MKMQSIEDLLYVGMTYALDAENKLSKLAGKMAEASEDSEVKEMFQKSVTQGEKYAERIEAAFSKLGKKKDTAENHIIVAMVNEVEDMISNTEKGAVRDAALIVAINQQQAYRVSTYGSLSSYAKLINKSDAVSDLQQSLDEAKAGDEKLTNIAEQKVNPKAAQQQVAA